ncbi:hypothetical protein DY000_02001034 [Brassica cretica]|uniref:Uncharacterized protein n=1 Tax=Brassica cretica TaxID=69181 RepID=A0ABQ7C3F5_BRACR|nr:hypothetical protein DY000_02001034 [Brassica cretica]
MAQGSDLIFTSQVNKKLSLSSMVFAREIFMLMGLLTNTSEHKMVLGLGDAKGSHHFLQENLLVCFSFASKHLVQCRCNAFLWAFKHLSTVLPGAHQAVVIRRDFKASPAMLDAEVKGSYVVIRLYHHMFKATQDAVWLLVLLRHNQTMKEDMRILSSRKEDYVVVLVCSLLLNLSFSDLICCLFI